MPTYSYYCMKCDAVKGIIVKYDERDEDQQCDQCGNPECSRTWAESAPTILKASYRDGHKRFDDIRLANKMKQARQIAKAGGDTQLYNEIKREEKKVGGK